MLHASSGHDGPTHSLLQGQEGHTVLSSMAVQHAYMTLRHGHACQTRLAHPSTTHAAYLRPSVMSAAVGLSILPTVLREPTGPAGVALCWATSCVPCSRYTLDTKMQSSQHFQASSVPGRGSGNFVFVLSEGQVVGQVYMITYSMA